MKKFIAVLICFSMLLAGGNVFASEEIVDVILDGQIMEFDVPARIYSDRTMVPMRAIFEELGADVEWIEEENLIFAVRNETAITMKIGQNYFTIQDMLTNESQKIELDVAPMIVNDRTLVPVRAVAESLDCLVEWDDANRDVIIMTEQ